MRVKLFIKLFTAVTLIIAGTTSVSAHTGFDQKIIGLDTVSWDPIPKDGCKASYGKELNQRVSGRIFPAKTNHRVLLIPILNKTISEPPLGSPDKVTLPEIDFGIKDDRQVDIFFTPHPDDETLSMGVMVANAKKAGHRVIIVALTDGRTTGSIKVLNAKLQKALPSASPLTSEEVALARDKELIRAMAVLGIPESDIHFMHFDTAESDCSHALSFSEARAAMDLFAREFPSAYFVTMSAIAERHPDHLAAGEALLALERAGVISPDHVLFTVSRLWWGLPSPTWRWLIPHDPEKELLSKATSEYLKWDPNNEQYSIGFLSVEKQFGAFVKDFRNRIHGIDGQQSGIH